MNERQMFHVFADTFRTLVSLSRTKGEEYTGGGQADRLQNFKDAATRTGTTPLTALFFALDKHYQSFSTFVKDHQNGRERGLSEPIEGRLNDLILYAMLAKCLTAEMSDDLPGEAQMDSPEGRLAMAEAVEQMTHLFQRYYRGEKFAKISCEGQRDWFQIAGEDTIAECLEQAHDELRLLGYGYQVGYGWGQWAGEGEDKKWVTLAQMREAKQGLMRFRVVCDETNNSQASIDQNKLHIDLVPVQEARVEVSGERVTISAPEVRINAANTGIARGAVGTDPNSEMDWARGRVFADDTHSPIAPLDRSEPLKGDKSPLPKPHHNSPHDLRFIQEQICDWATQAFPDRSVNSIRRKLVDHEIPELLLALGQKRWKDVDEEGVDVVFLLLDLFMMRGVDIGFALLQKLAINRGRTWAPDGEGMYSHVKKSA